MKIKPIVTGISMGVTAGAIAYAMTASSERDKKMLRSRAGKAFHAMGDVMDGIAVLMHNS
jgi:hypothetical protein